MDRKINLIKFIEKINKDLTKTTQEIELNEENNVTELHIHKILFIVYGSFYKKFNKDLFDPNFQAWKYGPVEIDFRKSFKEEKEEYSKFNVDLNTKEEYIYLNKLITKLLKFSAWSLVEYTHTLNAWINNYDSEGKNLNQIPKEDIIENFKDIDFIFN